MHVIVLSNYFVNSKARTNLKILHAYWSILSKLHFEILIRVLCVWKIAIENLSSVALLLIFKYIKKLFKTSIHTANIQLKRLLQRRCLDLITVYCKMDGHVWCLLVLGLVLLTLGKCFLLEYTPGSLGMI